VVQPNLNEHEILDALYNRRKRTSNRWLFRQWLHQRDLQGRTALDYAIAMRYGRLRRFLTIYGVPATGIPLIDYGPHQVVPRLPVHVAAFPVVAAAAVAAVAVVAICPKRQFQVFSPRAQ
jgi:hypothetical protein